MSADQDALIRLLNGDKADVFCSDDLFFDENGEATDRFLEALKSDKLLPDLHQISDSLQQSLEKPSILVNGTYGNYPNHLDDESDDGSFFEHYAEKKTKPKSSRISKASKSGTAERATIKKLKKRLDPESSIQNELKEKDHPVGRDLLFVEIEADSKVKALELRIQGHLKTIRSLEAQLRDAHDLIKTRNKQLGNAHAHLKSLKPEVIHTVSNDMRQLKDFENRVNGKANEMVDKYKRQMEILHSKYSEEQSKRQKAEDRAKALKEYAEKSKNRCLALEAQCAELQASCTDATNRLARYKKTAKDNGSDVLALRTAASDKDNQLSLLLQRIEKLESSLRNVRLPFLFPSLPQHQMDLDQSYAELRNKSVELYQANSRVRELSIQLELFNERTAVKKAEKRISNMERERDRKDRAQAALRKSFESEGSQVRRSSSTQRFRSANVSAMMKAVEPSLQDVRLQEKLLDEQVLRESAAIHLDQRAAAEDRSAPHGADRFAEGPVADSLDELDVSLSAMSAQDSLLQPSQASDTVSFIRGKVQKSLDMEIPQKISEAPTTKTGANKKNQDLAAARLQYQRLESIYNKVSGKLL